MDQGAYRRAESDFLEARELLRGLKHALEEIDVLLRLAALYAALGGRATSRQYMAELEGLKLPVLRPDLVEEFEAIKRALAQHAS